jgi:hypothetical protein
LTATDSREKSKTGVWPRPCRFVGFEGPHLFLCHADEHDAFTRGEPGAVRRDELVFALAAFEGDERHVMIAGTLLDGRENDRAAA